MFCFLKAATDNEGSHANSQASHKKAYGQSKHLEDVPKTTPKDNKDRRSPTTMSSRTRRIEDEDVQESSTNESKIFSASRQENGDIEQRSHKIYDEEPRLIDPNRRRHSNHRTISNERQINNNKHGRSREYSPPSIDRRNRKRDFDDKNSRSNSREYGSNKSENTRRQSSRNQESRVRQCPSRRFLTESKHPSSANGKHRSRSKSK